MKIITKVTVIIILMSIGLQPACGDLTLEAEEKNFLVLLEAVSQDSGGLGVFSGIEPGNMLVGSGTFNSSGWTWNLSCTYLGLPLNLTYVGTFDAASDIVSWSGTGNFGVEPWDVSGTAEFIPGDMVNWSQTGTIGTMSDDWEVIGSLGFSFGAEGISFEGISLGGTYNGKDATITQSKTWNPSTGDWSGYLDVRRIVDDILEIGIRVEAEGTGREGSVTTGVIITPEPVSVTLALLGLGTAASVLRRRRALC